MEPMKSRPTAKQFVVFGHEIPASGANRAEDRSALGRRLQAFPSQCVISDDPNFDDDRLLAKTPTAKQLAALGHDTLNNWFTFAPGLGLDTIDHFEPFHCSTSVCPQPPCVKLPTATQLFVVVHETPARPLGSVPWFGLGTIPHFAPFHRSMSVLDAVLVEEPPTAMQNDVLRHDTAASPLCVEPGAFGLGETAHPETVGRSIKVWTEPVFVVC